MTELDRHVGRPRRIWRHAPLLAAAGVVLTMLPGSAAPSVTVAPLRTTAVAQAAVPLPAACKPTSNPPPTEYGFVARVTGGTVQGDGPLKVTGIDVSVCGIVRLVAAQSGGCTGVQGRLIIPKEGVVTNGLEAGLVIDGMPPMGNVPTEVIAEPMSSDIACDDSDDGLTMDLRLKINGSAGIFGLQCRVPFTGEVQATVTGPLLTPPFQGTTTITGTVAAGSVSNNDKFCPGQLPKRLNAIAELPAMGYQVNWPTTVSIYQP
ncbi:hypothetical protein RB608_27560 [Nocardioides sp. LHD-245]|uniref:hypothetical protein n=1 Tax=Nocardioides sp. LHD-245 TaxID=3051387 RepID=UPI0027E0ABDE|nr:hypothetical protein [Nocardioides sp. LHD-245]